MSKVDSQRAMREAKYARTQGSGGPSRREVAAAGRPPAAGAAPAGAARPDPGAEDAPVPAAAAPTADRCGHKSMNGRACTREAGHAEKNHRYG